MKAKKFPKFTSSKTVGAVQIKSIKADMKGGALLVPNVAKNSKMEPLKVSHNFLLTYDPKPNDYYVANNDGSVSVIAEKVFKKDFKAAKKPSKKDSK
jgi:hypothetical protein